MSNTNHSADVIVVGAGLAGLSAAITASRAGLSVLVIEGADRVGGRVVTDKIDGYTLDRGFQVFNPAYANAAALLNYDALSLRSFSPGVRLFDGTQFTEFGNPLRDVSYGKNVLSLLKHRNVGALKDLAAFGIYAGNASRHGNPAMLDVDARTALQQAGLSDVFIEKTLAPFLTGVFLEDNLETSRRFLDFVLGYFIKGVPALPADGMQAIAEQLVANLHTESVKLNTWVHGVHTGRVHTDEGELTASAVIVATDADTAHAWLNTPQRAWRSVTTWYHTTDCARSDLAAGRAQLTIDQRQGHGPVINTVPLSHVSASYAPAGKHLISTSTLGTDTSEAQHDRVKQHLSELYQTNAFEWELLKVYPIERALPVTLPPAIALSDIEVTPGLFVAGDHVTSTSIDGAMQSGVAAAKRAIAAVKGI